MNQKAMLVKCLGYLESALLRKPSSTDLIKRSFSTSWVALKKFMLWHDAFPACRGGPTTRELMLANEKYREVIKQRKTFLGKYEEPAEPIVYENRNPRNTELLGYNQPRGFSTLHKSRSFFIKLNLRVKERDGDDLGSTTAWVENISGHILCSASTTEQAIGRHLHSPVDVSAAVNVARVLGQRCRETGVTRVHWNPHPYQGRKTRLTKPYYRGTGHVKSEKIEEFENTLVENGLQLEEGNEYRRIVGWPQTLPEARKHREYPGRMTNYQKNRYTVKRRNDPDWVEDKFRPGIDDRAPFGAIIDHQAPDL